MVTLMSIIIVPIAEILTTGQIVCRVSVSRNCTPQQVLEATGRKQRTITSSVVNLMPKGEDDEVEVVFFKLNRFIGDNHLGNEYKSHELKPADPYSLAAVNQFDPAFADEHPNGTHWKNADDKWCYSVFHNRYCGDRVVDVISRDGDSYIWDCYWWFAGIRIRK